MGPLRRLLLSLALVAGLVPAISFAAAPPPVPALPDTERRTSYSITGTTCACAVNFAIYGDATDVDAWIEVFVNGVPKLSTDGTFGWKITSPTGPLATIPRPITDAVLTFNAVQTATVQIVGARRPRRVSQFSENRGVAARDLNQAITDLVAQLRENWDKTNDLTGRAVLARPGETLNLLPILANRQNLGACFDSGGNLTSCISVPSSTFVAGNGITLTGVSPTTITNNIAAGTGISITGTNPLTINSTVPGAATLYVRPQDFGAVCDGVTNDATALQNMITASAGKTIFIPAGTCLTNSTLTMPSNTTITGGGRDVSILKSTANPALSGANISNINLNNFQILGTDSVVSWVTSSFGPIKIVQNGSAGVAGINYTIRNMKFAGFNVSYWIYFDTTGSTFPLSNITFTDNYLLTTSADIPSSGTANQNGNYGIAWFTNTAGNGAINNSIISRNRFESTGMCYPIDLLSNQIKFEITDNIILSPGLTTPGHCVSGDGSANNAYGVLVYDVNSDGHGAQDGIISRNVIVSPLSAGIYVVGDSTGTGHIIANNMIDNQTAQDDTTLLRGGIVLSGPTNTLIEGNNIQGSFGGIAVGAQTTGTVSILNNQCRGGAGAVSVPFCVRLSAGIGAGNNEKFFVKGNTLEQFSAGAIVIRTTSVTGNRFNDVDISDNTIITATSTTGLDLSAAFTNSSFLVNNNRFLGSGTAANVTGITGTIAILSNVGLSFTAATLPTASNGSNTFVTDGTPASSPCTGASTGSQAFRQNSAWKCF